MNVKIFVLIIFLLLLISCNNNNQGLSGGQEKTSCVCTQNYDPVCGSDGKTYSNPCFAKCAEESYEYGEC